MSGDRWTFVVVRGRNGPVRQYSLSTRVLEILAGGGGVAALLLLVTALTIGLDGAATLRAKRLAIQNDALRQELADFQSRMGRLESAFGDLAERDTRYRMVAGLEMIDPEIMEVGVGGPGLRIPETHPLWNVDSLASKSVYALSYDLNALERRARLLGESLAEATDTVLAHRDLLESTPSIRPTRGWFSSSFSMSRMHPIHNRPLPHPGLDIQAPKGTPIYAAAKGRVLRAEWVVGYGLTVEIDHGFGFTTLYGHASQLLVSAGQEVTRGDVIAQVGSTGISTSAHLHYEVRLDDVAQDPKDFILPDRIP